MAKKKIVEKDQRMMRDAAGNPVPARFFGGWIEASTYDAMVELGVRHHRKLVDEQRQALREYVDRHKENGT